MTLNEAIIHAENEVWKNSREADRCFSHGGSWYEEKAKSCKACADEHRQLAEWLKELKVYRETYPYGVDRFNGSDTSQPEEKHAICNGCVYRDLPNAFHPCASCVDFSKYVGEVSGDTPQEERSE